LLLLEMTCVHELAHVIYTHRSIPQNILKLSLSQQVDPEPLFSAMDPVMELGEALECYLFGEILHFLGVPNDGSLKASGNVVPAWMLWVSPDPAIAKNKLATGRQAVNWGCLSLVEWSHVWL
jgi:hypothetical protein